MYMIRCVPGFAFRNSLPNLELQEIDLQRLASSSVQRQFYQVKLLLLMINIIQKENTFTLTFYMLILDSLSVCNRKQGLRYFAC